MKIAILGYGFVGKAVFTTLSYTHTLIIVDPKYYDNKLSDHPDVDAIIVCVGTPENYYGDCDDSQIIAALGTCPENVPILLKSTVPPDKLLEIKNKFSTLSLSYSPEFLRASTAINDFKNQNFMILAGDDITFWRQLFVPILPHCLEYFECGLKEAATAKYVVNSFLAAKVDFFNQIYDMCQAADTDYEMVTKIISRDSRIGTSHVQVPGPDGNRGFGGACFPKDTQAFTRYANRIGVSFDVLQTVIEHNDRIRN